MKLQVKPQLAVLRAKHDKISQSELSRQTGITKKQLSALETGKTKGITFETLAKLCLFFDCTPNELLQLEEIAEIETSPTKEELSLADEIIARGLSRAINSPQRPTSEIWAEFDAVRAKLANSATNPDKLVHQDI
ncbi:MAG: helix-turn-helix transcriptional regulator [Cyanobacteria bacterium P01_F01_bin.143]